MMKAGVSLSLPVFDAITEEKALVTKGIDTQVAVLEKET